MSAGEREVRDFRHREAHRKNNPPAGIASTYEVRERRTIRYAYDPHLDPQLVWAGKAEHSSFEVAVVSLHIHERISTRAILEAVKKPEPQLSLFGETPLPTDQQIEFYQHKVGWANRLILDNSLPKMSYFGNPEDTLGEAQRTSLYSICHRVSTPGEGLPALFGESPQVLPITAMTKKVVEEEHLRQLVLNELATLGFKWAKGKLSLPKEQTKTFSRQLHEPARRMELIRRQEWLRRKLPRYLSFFANGHEINPKQVQPVLIVVTEEWQHELFRIARLTWSLPYSKGFGRRLRFLVMDNSNGKLIGILALQSPPLSFPARDQLFNYPEGRKVDLVNQTMDIHTLGAVPPYNRLLGGKLVAMAAVSNEVREAYRRKYQGRVTEMEGRILPAHLVALTTTSAFGRSSIYNRLTYNGDLLAQSLGYTEGYGSFHLAHLYEPFREYLEAQGISTRGGFGTGPRVKWQTMVRALERLGFSAELLKHGVKREAFLFPLIRNLKDYMEGRAHEPEYFDRPFAELAAYWRERWLLGRAKRVDGWQEWKREEIATLLSVAKGEAT